MRERESLFLTECFNIGSPPATPSCNAFMSPTLKNGGLEPVPHAESQDCLRKYRQCVEGATDFASRLLHSGDRSRTPAFKQFPAAKCLPANARGLASSLLATEIVWIFLSIEHGDQRKEILMVSRIQIGPISAI